MYPPLIDPLDAQFVGAFGSVVTDSTPLPLTDANYPSMDGIEGGGAVMWVNSFILSASGVDQAYDQPHKKCELDALYSS